MKSKFVHLHVHSEYSLLDGLPKISNLIEKIKESKMTSVALTDHGSMYGAIEFYKKAKKEGVKPIVGMEGYITNVELTEKPERGKFKNYHLTLLARNDIGYKNLMKLASIAHLKGYYYRPRFDRKTLEKYSKGLICASGCAQGELSQALVEDDYSKALKIAKWYFRVFKDDYYLEIQRHEYDKAALNAQIEEIKTDLLRMHRESKKISSGIVKISRELGIPLVATNDAHYLNQDDATAQDSLVCIATGKNVTDIKRIRFIDNPDFYIKSPEEMIEQFADLPDAIENSVKIAEKCNLEIKLGDWHFPLIDLPEGVTAEEFLVTESKKGLKEKFGKPSLEYKNRLEYELKVINDKGYAPYFIIFLDMANWAKKRKIPINIRGSVAGSLTTYVLGITTVDPIHYDIPFERFLNPFRPSAPDIDLDISDDKREDLIRYLTKKYGEDKVAQICTFGRMLARGSVRDVARVLGYPYATGDKIAKLIPLGAQGFPMTIDKALDENLDLRELYNTDSDSKKVIDLAKQVEGNARHISVHAAGVVVAPTALTNFTPLQREPSGDKIITQFEMHACEDVGLVKLDILGIRNLSILRESIVLAKKTKDIDIDISEINLDDKKTFEMLSRGETMGVFQLSSSGMTRYLVDMKPEKVEDIMMMIALYRPGPMNNIDEYIARKQGKREIEYYHPKMKEFLDKSLGVLVYQDDLLYTAIAVAGYNWLEVDKFRKAVGKKIPEEMARQHDKFVKGSMKHSNMTKKEAEGLWDLFEPFQGYGFNKAHSASYGMVSYWTAYMKANYPVEYMTALLTAESSDKDKVSAGVSECRRMGINVLPPDINESEIDFTIVKDEASFDDMGIRFGLSAIKNVGKVAIEVIMNSRKNGEFTSFADFLSRIDARKVNKRVLESLIKVGALSSFGSRAGLLSSMEEIRGRVGKLTSVSEGQQGLFGEEEEKKVRAQVKTIETHLEEFSDEELASLERQLLGFSISSKPPEELIGPLASHATHKINDISAELALQEIVRIAAIVSEVRVVVTRKTASEMAFVKVEDGTGSINLVVFPKIFSETKDLWVDRNPILISGKIDSRDDEMSILVDSVDTIDSVASSEGNLTITIPKDTSLDRLKVLKQLLVSNPGNQEAVLIFEGRDNQKIKLPYGVSWNHQVAKQISEILEARG